MDREISSSAQARDANEDLLEQFLFQFESDVLKLAKSSRSQAKDDETENKPVALAYEQDGPKETLIEQSTEQRDERNLGAIPKIKKNKGPAKQQALPSNDGNSLEERTVPLKKEPALRTMVVYSKRYQEEITEENGPRPPDANSAKTRSVSRTRARNRNRQQEYRRSKIENESDVRRTEQAVDNQSKDRNDDNSQAPPKKRKGKRGGVKLRNKLQQQKTNSPAVDVKPSAAQEPPVREDNSDAQFREEMNNCKSRIMELQSAVERLKLAKANAQRKPNKQDEIVQQMASLEAKINELVMQTDNAQIAFDRTNFLSDSVIRKKRELFRIVGRLPALAKRQHFEKAFEENQFVVVMGQTGSGKSTQLTQYIADMAQSDGKYVICTQPRKIAAVTLSRRVAFEYSGGQETPESKKWVGCHVGGDYRCHINNRIRYMTETVLLNLLAVTEASNQKDLFRDCCAVVVDEAHTRTITTDVLLGVLKRKIHLWPHLKVVVTSATIDTNLFSKYLNDCPVIDIPGRLFPVEVVYCPFDREKGNMIDAVVNQALSICDKHQSGDVLCFLTGQNEVEWAKKRFTSSFKSKASRAKRVVAYCLYGKQTPEEQQKVFVKTPDVQKVIFTTDIAETSVTIDGVKFIVDSGFTKNLVFDSARNITSLKEMMISCASAEQRKGRAGRTGPGICYRIYSEDDFNAMPKYDKAEIFLRPLSITVTLLKAINVDPRQFDWLEQPDGVALEAAMEELCLLGALDHLGNLTPIGHLISDLQIDPGFAHMIHYACSRGLGNVATILVGLFSVTSLIFWRGSEDETRQASNESKKTFIDPKGDIMTGYRAFTEWRYLMKADPTKSTAKAWCMDNYINNKAMNMAWSTAQEIETSLQRSAMHIWRRKDQSREATDEEMQQLIAQAFVLNVAYQVNKNYVALRANTMTYVHPGSVFFRGTELAQVVVYQQILTTSKTYALQITPIDMEWIRQENGALHALYEERKSQVNICEVRITPVSRKILRFILGPGNSNIEQLNNELDCDIHGEYEKDALVAWCKPNARNFVHSELSRRINARKRELELEIREDSIVGETRIVWGCGGEAKLLMFHGQYITINVQNVPITWRLSDVIFTVSQKLSQPVKGSLRDVVLLPQFPNRNDKTARIIFDDPKIAATGFKELSNGLRKPLTVSPVLSNRPSIYKETEAWLNISFAIAPSKKSAIIMYGRVEDANLIVSRGLLGFRPSNLKDGARNSEVVDGALVHGANRSKLGKERILYANRLPVNFDEFLLERHITTNGCPLPTYTKIIRGEEMKFETDPVSPLSTDRIEAILLNYAKANDLLPLPDKIVRVIVSKDSKRKKVFIRARYQSIDQIEMINVSQLLRSQHYDQPVRATFQIKTSLRLEKTLWEFRRTMIESYLKTLDVDEAQFRIDAKFPTHVWLYLDVPRVEKIQEIRRQIDTFLAFQLYKNESIELLFTHYGRKLLTSLKVNGGYLNWNFATMAIRIYGDEAERKVLKGQLDNLIKRLRPLRIDVPLIIRKTSLATVKRNLESYMNNMLHDEIRLSYNRLYATGTEEGIEMLKAALKTHLIEPKDEVEVGDCGVCWSPLENPIYFQLCAHGFCTDCIKAMVEQESVPYPIVCPADGCGLKVCLKDIQEIASIGVLEKISQSAIAALQTSCPDKFRTCFRPGCEQYIPIPDKTPQVEDNVSDENSRSGADVVYCDQCNVHYCFKCSTVMKKPVEQHRGSTCSENQLLENKSVRQHRLYILDELCLLRCPRCKTAFIDFDGCCALTCAMGRCNAGFCFFCLTDCGSDAHSHVIQCPKNPARGEFHIRSSQKNSVHKESRKKAIVNYLMKTCRDRGMRSAVLHSIVRDLQDLEITINPSEVDLAGFTPLIETSQHRDHILNEICTLRCPRCRMAFFDFEGCSALTCANNTCKTMFCFFCLKGFGRDEQRTFAHVIQCPENIVPGQLHTPAALIEEANRRRYKKAIVAYLKSHCPDATERRAVIDSVSDHLKQLKVSVSDRDFAPPVPRYDVVADPVLNIPVAPAPQYRYAQRVGPIPARPYQPAFEPIRQPIRVDPIPARPYQPAYDELFRQPLGAPVQPARPQQPLFNQPIHNQPPRPAPEPQQKDKCVIL